MRPGQAFVLRHNLNLESTIHNLNLHKLKHPQHTQTPTSSPPLTMRYFIFILLPICLVSSFASAAITLSDNFMDFTGTGSGSPAGASSLDDCRALYNSRINECTDSLDFSEAYCRQPCQQALRNIEAKLNNFCRGVTAKPGTLLEAIFSKKLVESICRDGGALGPQGSVRLTTVTKPVATETARVTTTEADDGKDVTTTLKSTLSSLTTATFSSSRSTSTTSATNFPISSGTLTPAAPTPTMGWREKARQDQACAILQGGGGSPFDNMIQFKPPMDGKDRQQRIRDCEGIAKQRTLELKAKKSAGSRLSPWEMGAVAVGLVVSWMAVA